jgi:predicted HAD superfamily Cof-like phosphohydrolase
MTETMNLGPMLQEFIKAFGASLDARLWYKLVKEELAELKEAMDKDDKANTLKELCDVLYVYGPFNTLIETAVQADLIPEEEAKEITEYLQTNMKIFQKAVTLFPPMVVYEAFVRVHKSNMSKLGLDGKPIKREDGKVMKGPNYTPPDLSDLVEDAA